MENKDIVNGFKNIQSLIQLFEKEISLANTGYDREEYDYCKKYCKEAVDYLDGVIQYLFWAKDDINEQAKMSYL